MKMEKIIKDGKMIGIKRVFEAGDKFYEQFGEFIYLTKEPSKKDYENLINIVANQMVEHIKDSDKKWDYEGCEFILKSKQDLEGYPDFPKNSIGTLGAKLIISRIVEEGENL